MIFAPPPAVLPSTFPLDKGSGDGFGGGAEDCLVLRRPSACWGAANGDGGAGGAGGEGPREEGAGAAAAAAAAATAAAGSSSQGRLGRVARWRGGGGAERRQAEGDGGGVSRRPLELSPAMELLFSSLSTS